ncbi:gamma-glutamylcyclotransferase [Arcobacter sp. 31_11_sub10_T18]|nr:gamma-glutamylcyclotransferase [Arcobacter sp. 31_11_sub10_T18]
MYLFGYGSLINITSAQKSFKRKLLQTDLLPVKIKGYKKVWNSIEDIEFEERVNGIFLNLEKNDAVDTYGVVIKISDEELEILKIREKNYSCITIDASKVLNVKLDSNVIAFMTTKTNKIAKIGHENSYIASKYIDIIESSFDSYDEVFIKDYEKCLSDLPFEVKDGTYKFSDPSQNKFAKQGLNK